MSPASYSPCDSLWIRTTGFSFPQRHFFFLIYILVPLEFTFALSLES